MIAVKTPRWRAHRCAVAAVTLSVISTKGRSDRRAQSITISWRAKRDCLPFSQHISHPSPMRSPYSTPAASGTRGARRNAESRPQNQISTHSIVSAAIPRSIPSASKVPLVVIVFRPAWSLLGTRRQQHVQHQSFPRRRELG